MANEAIKIDWKEWNFREGDVLRPLIESVAQTVFDEVVGQVKTGLDIDFDDDMKPGFKVQLMRDGEANIWFPFEDVTIYINPDEPGNHDKVIAGLQKLIDAVESAKAAGIDEWVHPPELIFRP